MAARTTEPEYDFDSWSEEDEAKAIEALKPDVRYIIVEESFVGRFPDGAIVKMPLEVSLDDVDALEGLPPVDQFKTLLGRIGGDEATAEFTRHSLAETAVMAEKFFRVFSRIAKASLPE
ncbi:hypothetical protein QWJ90_01305 [Microbacterium oryzae]|uniref:hypothetical protein n=1 Tax=Microbacterium oryzae TaxID=743009 RepID=UPI0025B1AC86|nr:hypothetical protein [Microbacterium oryzae]MDN3309559.1 hypothetical protein [Microbacterium oryzae]